LIRTWADPIHDKQVEHKRRATKMKSSAEHWTLVLSQHAHVQRIQKKQARYADSLGGGDAETLADF
jgi:hypothetical protein